MSNNENKTGYQSIDFNALNEKISGSMLVAGVSSIKDKDAAESVFNHIKESYSYDELVYMASVHVGAKLKEALENRPELGNMIKIISHLGDMAEKFKQDEKN